MLHYAVIYIKPSLLVNKLPSSFCCMKIAFVIIVELRMVKFASGQVKGSSLERGWCIFPLSGILDTWTPNETDRCL